MNNEQCAVSNEKGAKRNEQYCCSIFMSHYIAFVFRYLLLNPCKSASICIFVIVDIFSADQYSSPSDSYQQFPGLKQRFRTTAPRS